MQAEKPYASWHLIYNLDGTFRGYEWALDENGDPCPSRVYAQEGRDDSGRPIVCPDTPPA